MYDAVIHINELADIFSQNRRIQEHNLTNVNGH